MRAFNYFNQSSRRIPSDKYDEASGQYRGDEVILINDLSKE
jgi:hypothetical protein